MLFGFFVAACDMGAFPQRFAATIAGAAKGWQMGVWPNIAPAWLCLSSDTDPDKGDGLRGIPPSRRQKTSASGGRFLRASDSDFACVCDIFRCEFRHYGNTEICILPNGPGRHPGFPKEAYGLMAGTAS